MNITHSISRFAARIGSTSRLSLMAVGMAAGVSITVGAMAQNAGGAWHHAHATAASVDVAGHVDGVLQHVYIEVGATPAQQAQIAPRVQAAATNLMQLHTQFHAEHAQMLGLLLQDSIDRSALENSRAAQLVLVDQASREIVQLMADTAQILTPAQRKALGEKLAAHLGASIQN
jgi:protein CpxP